MRFFIKKLAESVMFLTQPQTMRDRVVKIRRKKKIRRVKPGLMIWKEAMCPKFLHCGLRLFCKIVAFSRGFISDMGKSWSTCAHITGTLEMFQAQE